MSKSRYLSKALLDHVLGVANYTAPTNLYVGLSSTAPNDDGTNITEPDSGSYARADATGDFAAGVAGSPTTSTTINEIAFPESTAAWLSGASLTHFVIYDAAIGGNLLHYGALVTPRTVSASGITLRFAVGSLTLTEA